MQASLVRAVRGRVAGAVAAAGAPAWSPVAGGAGAAAGAAAIAAAGALPAGPTARAGTLRAAAPARGFASKGSAAKSADKNVGLYPGGKRVPFVSEPALTVPDDSVSVPAFQILDEDGEVRAGAAVPEELAGDKDRTLTMYRHMVRLQTMDSIFNDAQRQGRISFYMQAAGEEGIHIGSSEALSLKDPVFAQYREAGVLMHRGFSMQNFADQLFSNADDLGKGRQMPVHYGSHDLNYVTISSPLATQLPQASGAAYALKLAGGKDACVACFFGDGAASEGDFHAALNFAATLEAPVLFFCRNNGFAISTPIAEQIRGDGLIARAAGYGMASIRFDGNDMFAVYEATKLAREWSVSHSRPVFLEAMTYRQGHHSTSDDSTRYRSADEIAYWRDHAHPVRRVYNWLLAQGWWDEEAEKELRATERKGVLTAMSKAETKPKPPESELFSDVYLHMPKHLQEQQAQMRAHVALYPETYSGDGH